MKRTTVFLDEGLERDLKALAARKGEPAASLVREALGEYVTRHRHEELRLGFLAAGRSGRSEVAETHEEILWKDLSLHGSPGPHGTSGPHRDDRRGRADPGEAPPPPRRRAGPKPHR